jgi:hypothetical protein
MAAALWRFQIPEDLRKKYGYPAPSYFPFRAGITHMYNFRLR